jgi:hypothetical protein
MERPSETMVYASWRPTTRAGLIMENLEAVAYLIKYPCVRCHVVLPALLLKPNYRSPGDDPVETVIAVMDVRLKAAGAVRHLPMHTILDMLIALMFR